MHRTLGRYASAVIAMLSPALLPAPTLAVTVPDPFVVENALPGTGFNQPTAFAFTPDGRILVAEKRGVVRVVVKQVKQSTPMWDGQAEVLSNGDRGLLGIAVDPAFARNHYVYLLYTVDPDSNNVEDNNPAFGRLTRYQTSASDSNLLDPASRTVLIGSTWTDGFASGSRSHTIGTLRWGRDGSLLISAGEGAEYARADSGGLYPGLFGPGRTDSSEDIGAFRAQSLNSLAGKVLRVNPATGAGYTSNPFFDGDLNSNRSRVWDYGLRNPFRFCVRPGTGVSDTSLGNPGALYAGDVGWCTWEEINVSRRGGENFGWPYNEGPVAQPLYQTTCATNHGLSAIGTRDDPALPKLPGVVWNQVDSALSTPHGVIGSCVIGGVFYNAWPYPMEYHGGMFFADFGENWIKVATFDDQDQLVQLSDFASSADGPVDFGVDPVNGDVLYLAFFTGQLYRIRYTGTTDVPTARPRIALSSPFPNPSRGRVSLSLELPRATSVDWSIIDLQGREVWRDPARVFAAGRSQLAWSGERARDGRAPNGVYFARVNADGFAYTRRVVLFR